MRFIRNPMLYVAAFLVSGTAAAETPTVDTSAATDMISGDATTGIVAIGSALLVLAAVAIAFKWAKGAIFG